MSGFRVPEKDKIRQKSAGFVVPEKDRLSVSGQQEQPKPQGIGFLESVGKIAERGPLSAIKSNFQSNPEPYLNALPAAGITVGGLVGGIPGAGLGGAAGVATKQLLQRGMGIGNPPQSSGRSATDIGVGAAEGVATEFGGRLVKPVLGMIGGAGKKIGAMLSGMEAQKIGRIASEPTTMLPRFMGGPATIRAAGEAFGEAEKAAGLTIAPTAERVLNRIPEAKKTASETIGKLLNKEPITPKEALETKRALDDVIPSLKKHKTEFRQAIQWKKDMDSILSTQTGEFLNASKQYAKSLLRGEFLALLPKNADGTYSIARSGIVGALSHFLGFTPLGGLAVSAPITVGAAAAVSGAVGKALQNPVMRRYALATVADHVSGELKK